MYTSDNNSLTSVFLYNYKAYCHLLPLQQSLTMSDLQLLVKELSTSMEEGKNQLQKNSDKKKERVSKSE